MLRLGAKTRGTKCGNVCCRGVLCEGTQTQTTSTQTLVPGMIGCVHSSTLCKALMYILIKNFKGLCGMQRRCSVSQMDKLTETSTDMKECKGHMRVNPDWTGVV